MSDCSNKSYKVNGAVWTTSRRNADGSDNVTARNSAVSQELKVRRQTIPTRVATLVEEVANSVGTKTSREDFAKKRQDRRTEIADIKNMLTKITPNSDNRKSNSTEHRKHSNEKLNQTKFSRSKTELNMKSKPSKPIGPSKIIRCKSTLNLAVAQKDEPKKKSYNPEEARRYMNEQKKKRKSQPSATICSGKENVKSIKIDRDEIKKRLLNLQKNTRQILNENVNKTRKRKPIASDRNVKPEGSNNNHRLELIKPKSANTDSTTPQASSSPNYKKIGLLRKTETKDHSFSALNDIDPGRENVMDIFTPILKEKLESNIEKFAKSNAIRETRATSDKQTSYHSINIEKSQGNLLNLEGTANVTRKPSTSSLVEKSVQVSEIMQRKTKDIPYWLKPTPVQIYPYNFIMAVRKKLEAITKPVVTTVSSKSNLTENLKKPDVTTSSNSNRIQDTTPLSHPKPNRISNVKRRLTNIKDDQSFEISSSKFDTLKSTSKTLSEMASNFSSISIHIPESNTVSEVSSIKSESNRFMCSTQVSKSLYKNEQDDSANSMISSPERESVTNINRAPSPLSFEKIDSYKIKSKSISNSINVNRGDYLENPPLEMDISTKSTNRSDFNYSQLLVDFNRSLSQVIEVNDQLKSTLDKSQLIFSPNRNRHKAEKDVDLVLPQKPSLASIKSTLSEVYTSDFEEPVSSADTRDTDVDDTVLMMQSPEEIYNTVLRKTSLSSRIRANEKDDYGATFEPVIQSLKPIDTVVEKSPKTSIQGILHDKKEIPTLLPEVTYGYNYTDDTNSKSSSDTNIKSSGHNILEEVLNFPENHIASKVIFHEYPSKIDKDCLSDGKSILESSDKNQLQEKNVKESIHSLSGVSSFEEASATDTDSRKSSKTEERKTNLRESLYSIRDMSSFEETSAIDSDKHEETLTKSNTHFQSGVKSDDDASETYSNKTKSSKQLSIDKKNEMLTSDSLKLVHIDKDNTSYSSIDEELSIAEEINVSCEKDTNYSGNQYSKDSLDMADITREEVIQSHINTSRGDFVDADVKPEIITECTEPPGYSKEKNIELEAITSSQSSELASNCNPSDLDISLFSHTNKSLSESTLNYSSIGMFEQLIQNESSKSEQLTSLLKMREKALIDRTKGQIAWLEVQKEKYKAKGLTAEMSTIKKKQRAVLIKMQKEREDIKKLQEKQFAQENSTPSPRKQRQPKLARPFTELSIRKSNSSPTPTLVRGYEIETGKSLEILLQKREEELQKRRAHVERLMEWHKRLDHEEEEVLQLEKMLFEYNTHAHANPEDSRDIRMEKKLKEIDKSLRELSSISADADGINYVRTSGGKLNKLWRRLTGHKIEKFEDTRRYKLGKSDLEKLYEEAKKTVLQDFGKDNDMKDLLERSSFTGSGSQQSVIVNGTSIPKLNLNFSSGQSDFEFPNNFSTSLAEDDDADHQSSAHSAIKTESNHSEEVLENVTVESSIPDSDVINSAATAVEISSGILSKKHSTDSAEENLPDDSEPKTLAYTEPTIGENESTSNATVHENISPAEFSKSGVEENLSSTIVENGTKSLVIDHGILSKSVEITATESCIDTRDSVFISKSSENEIETTVSPVPHFDDSLESKISTEEHISSLSAIVEHPEPVKISDLDQSSDNNISYENDFDASDGTMLEDISLPKFESTCDESRSLFDEMMNMERGEDHSSRSDREEQSDLEKRLIDLDISLKGLQSTFERALSPEKSPPAAALLHQNAKVVKSPDSGKENQTTSKLSPPGSSLMPDIISEAEIRRRQQILVENEVRQFEHAVPYMYVREIPNKPPPPYVPPAHGSPMTTIFPSEDRIKDITYRRTMELYNEILKTDTPSLNGNNAPSVLDENITNIYERIILDICKECMNEFASTLMDRNPDNYKEPLAFFNPPNRARCMQEFVYKRIRKYLAMDKSQPKQNLSIFGIGRRKRDHVDEILIQELFEDETKWTNFDLEEAEVKTTIIDEILSDVVRDVIDEVINCRKTDSSSFLSADADCSGQSA